MKNCSNRRVKEAGYPNIFYKLMDKQLHKKRLVAISPANL
ncbi:hypothetical protein SAMD00020551_2892 [Mesobacillus selenatarsenatis SF-1]|uniref:Uncharacterized protein n=1 Tax=Mesobacillus selenatarsenatis (strain DSM 18680 / JCM 14380 / FERM P-15431 / SF-1) TaxID=1321606 RepID=A0A0A8X465_MESS1|nr:hypothetical protein SAMD00020551_2892 [Mesobacillus selenatarsenatis SF-1]